jgi:hypothetical protein
MTTSADLTPEEWQTVIQAPPAAGLIVVTASSGGTFRETFAMGKAYAEARQMHGESALLDEIASTKPKIDRHRYGSPEQLRTQGLDDVHAAVAVLEAKATPDEVDGFRRFVTALAEKVASAHREDGVAVSPPEQAALNEISAALGSPGA